MSSIYVAELHYYSHKVTPGLRICYLMTGVFNIKLGLRGIKMSYNDDRKKRHSIIDSSVLELKLKSFSPRFLLQMSWQSAVSEIREVHFTQ